MGAAEKKTRVLIVDDSSTMRSIVRKILAASRFAFDVHEAAEGIAAIEKLRRVARHVCLLSDRGCMRPLLPATS